MQAPVEDLVTQFTDDAFAKEDRVCQRTRCQALIRKGDPCHYVAAYDPAQPGRFVCAACYGWYRNKPATTARVNALPDPQYIRQSVSAAQSRASVNPPPVMAMSNTAPNLSVSGLMLPPAIPAVPHKSPHGPSVHVPSAWRHVPQSKNSRGSGNVMMLPPASSGYSTQHMHYAAQRERWARMAHNPPPAEMISLEMWAVFEAGGKKKNLRANNIGSICEGVKDIDALSTARELAVIALETLIPRVKAFFPQFHWREDEFVVRDSKWVDLTRHPSPQPYFYSECLHASNRKGSKATVFKSKQFMLFVIVPARQWEEFEAFREKLQSSPPVHAQHLSASSLPCSTVSTPVLPQCTTTSEPSSPLFLSNEIVSTMASSVFDRSISQDVLHPQPENKDTASSSNTGAMSAKRHHRHSSSTSSGSTPLPPQKKVAMTFSPPDRDQIKEALQYGGACEFDVNTVFRQKILHVDFYAIPTRDVDELVDKKAAFDIRDVELSSGTMRLDFSASALIGVGAFKTAQMAQLTLSPLRDSGIGSSANHSIVLKRPYIDDHPNEARPPFTRYTLKDDCNILYRKANALYWAKALLQMTYRFVDRAVEDALVPPPFEIPHLRFVDAGLIFAYSDVPPTTGQSVRTGSAVNLAYLVEEFIPTSSDKFVKYIHNSNAEPCFLVDTKAEEIAKFLAFTQHVQYVKTGGQVYISDYQGCGPLLTDPQILTHPDVSEGRKLFSEGNVEKGVALFETQHICNMFCRWGGFRLRAFSCGSKFNSVTT
ncbi:hypothetical protein EDD15DRAFT_2371224 [Pisolithus albus]|nr:hypothetical protein EDD15DRAFT_2371224 [Pisolithus albus]